MSLVDTYSVRRLGEAAEAPSLPRRLVTPIRFIPADREARLAMIHAAVSKARRSGLFDHCGFQP